MGIVSEKMLTFSFLQNQPDRSVSPSSMLRYADQFRSLGQYPFKRSKQDRFAKSSCAGNWEHEVRSTLKQFVRDWADEGAEERSVAAL